MSKLEILSDYAGRALDAALDWLEEHPMLNHYLGYLIVYFAGAVVAFSVPAWALGVPMWAFTKGVFAGAWVGAAWFGTRDAFRNGLI